MQYGYCGTPSVQWKLEYGNGYLGVGIYGKLNTMLIRTQIWTHPLWYDSGSYPELASWVNAINCGSSIEHVPYSATMGVQLLEQYRWRPKDANPKNGEIINYNAPCLDSQKRRKGLRLNYTVSLQGRGAIERSIFMDACSSAETYLEDLTNISVDSTWVHQSCNNGRPINDWETFSTSARLTAGPPSVLPDWTQMTISVSNLNLLGTSTLQITEVQYFTDQDSTDVKITSVERTLSTRAGVYNCPR